MQIQPYLRKVQYYETDAMGIVHHSNYIRWFEEARIDFMDQMGYTYARMEQEGIGSVILSVQSEYKKPVRFGESVRLHLTLAACKGVRMTVAYRVENLETGEVCCTGETKNCFVNSAGRPVALKKALPELYTLFLESASNAPDASAL